ncbi:MAG: diguanylate cyclase [Gammaproteobacteria bacterium]
MTGSNTTVVLLVDDQAMVAEAIRRMLATTDNIQFHYCQEPDKALEMAIEVKPSVILQDLVMPDVDGMTLMRFYKNHPETKNIPVIILSSKEDVSIKSDAFNSGANDYLVKLPDPIELIARIQAHSKHFYTQMERDTAYQIMQSMQEQLEASNTELEKSNLELQRLSCQDGLTGIANRRSFDKFIDAEWRRALRENSPVPMSVILIDIDYFKLYNDGYGHQAGDDCLIRVAQALDSCVHRASDMMARYGGEEFVAVLADTDEAGALIVAQRMHEAISALAIRHEHADVSDYVSLSMGVASRVPHAETAPEQLIADADKALYAAKEAGRNRSVAASSL